MSKEKAKKANCVPEPCFRHQLGRREIDRKLSYYPKNQLTLSMSFWGHVTEGCQLPIVFQGLLKIKKTKTRMKVRKRHLNNANIWPCCLDWLIVDTPHFEPGGRRTKTNLAPSLANPEPYPCPYWWANCLQSPPWEGKKKKNEMTEKGCPLIPIVLLENATMNSCCCGQYFFSFFHPWFSSLECWKNGRWSRQKPMHAFTPNEQMEEGTELGSTRCTGQSPTQQQQQPKKRKKGKKKGKNVLFQDHLTLRSSTHYAIKEIQREPIGQGQRGAWLSSRFRWGRKEGGRKEVGAEEQT